MVHKKKFFPLLKFFTGLLFSVLFLFFFTAYCEVFAVEMKQSSLYDEYISYEYYKVILVRCGLSENTDYSGDLAKEYAKINAINNWISSWNDRYVKKANINTLVFYKQHNGSNLCWILQSNYDEPSFRPYLNASVSTSYGSGYGSWSYFGNWNYNNDGSIKGVSYNSATQYYMNPSTNAINSTSGSTSATVDWIISGDSEGRPIIILPYGVYIDTIHNLESDKWIYNQIYYNLGTNYYGYTQYFCSFGYPLTTDTDIPDITPTPTGTSTPVPTGGGSTDLSETNQKLDNIENALTNTPSGDDFISVSSGDMLSALDLPAIEDPTANFWLSITDGLTTALTCPNNTSIEIPFIGASFTANSSDFELPDGDLKRLIRMACVVGFVIIEYKLIRKIIAYFSSGVFKQIFNAYSRMDISDLF